MLNQFRATLFLAVGQCLALFLGWSATTPVIFSTVVNSSNNQITITGRAFSPTAMAPSVALNNTIDACKLP
jgi:hypothetical protein